MAEIGRWGGHKFEVSPTLIRGFSGLQIKGSSETEDQEGGGEKFVSRKSPRPMEITTTIHLNALVGCDVRKEAIDFVGQARSGKKDYFYIGNQKLVAYQLMLTDATVNEVEIAAGGKWVRAKVQLTLKQCSKADGSTTTTTASTATTASTGNGGGGGGGGAAASNKASVKVSSVVSNVISSVAKNAPTIATVASAAITAGTAVKNALTGKTTVANAATTVVKSAVTAVAAVVSKAKTTTATTKTTSVLKTAVAKVTAVKSTGAAKAMTK